MTQPTPQAPLGILPKASRLPAAPQADSCTTCDSDVDDLLYGDDPDGFVLCRECRLPLFYCDLGGPG